MPSKSASQARLMAAVAHNPAFSKKVGIPQSVGKEFNQADKGKKFREGGTMQMSKLFRGKETYGEELKEAKAIKSGKITPEQYARGEKREKAMKKMSDGGMTKYERMKQQAQEEQRDAKLRGFTDKAYEGSLTNTEMQPLPYRPKGGVDGMLKGGDGDMSEARTLPNRITPGKKSKLDEMPVKYARGGGIESRGKTKGTMIKMATGGFVRAADGVAQRGKTKAKQIGMKRGGAC